MKVKIKNKQVLSEQYLLVEFDLLNQPFPFIAGQFFTLTLLYPPFTDQRGNSRKFGFINSPTDTNTISILTKIGVSAFKKSLQELPVAIEVEIGLVDGRNHLPANDVNQPLAWVAGGIGIAPFMSIIRNIKARSLRNKITLIYVNRNKNEAIFLEELELYAKQNQLFKFISIISELNIVSAELIKNQITDFQNGHYVITGEQNFVIPTFKIIKGIGVDVKNIVMEIFTGY